jgi:hypothetical protein
MLIAQSLQLELTLGFAMAASHSEARARKLKAQSSKLEAQCSGAHGGVRDAGPGAAIAECCCSPERRHCQRGGSLDAHDAPVTHLEEKRLREYAVAHDEWMILRTHGREATTH